MSKKSRNMNKILTLSLLLFSLSSCAQVKTENGVVTHLIGGCEGCEAIFEYGSKELSDVDTLPDFHESGMRIKVTGKIYHSDGITPAKDVILYVYHTDQHGIYATRGGETGWARRHGYNRGWMKTSEEGRYTFLTLKPGTYPDRREAAHIHPTILEPGGKYYWLGSYYFANDPLLTSEQKAPATPRGGTAGVLTLRQDGDIWVGERNFILGKNVPGYE